jgi:OmpA family
MKPFQITCFLFLFVSGISSAQTTATLHFPSGSSAISAVEKNQLNDLLSQLDAPFPCLTMVIEGHTDADGDEVANRLLSQKRAEGVAQYFTDLGFPAQNITTRYQGEYVPANSNETESAKEANRRVEITFVKSADCNTLGMEKKAQVIPFDASKSFTYKDPNSGTKIEIAANSFIDENGNPVAGEVDLKYTEWRTSVDFMLSGITMDFPSQGSDTHFSSVGMFELKAFQNDSELQLAEGKNINMKFAATDTGNGVGFYQFDESQKTWTSLQPEITPFTRGKNYRCNVDFLKYKDAVELSQKLFITPRENPDIAPGQWPTLNERFSHPDYVGSDYAAGLSFDEIQKRYMIRIEVVSKDRKGLVQEYKLAADYSMFPELKALSGIVFTVPKGSRYHITNDMLQSNFCDARVDYDHKIDRWIIKLKRFSGIVEFKHEGPLVYDEPVNSKTYSNKFLPLNEYRTILNNRLWNFELYATQKFDECFWLNSQVLMENTDEKNMTAIEWRTHYLNHYSEMSTRYQNAWAHEPATDVEYSNAFASSLNNPSTSVRRWYAIEDSIANVFRMRSEGVSAFSYSLTLSGTGIFNCDRMYKNMVAINITPQWKDAEGRDLAIYTLYLVDQKVNGALNYSPGSLKIDQTADYSILAVGLNGKKYILPASEYPEGTLSNGSKPVFQLREIAEGVNHPEAIQAMLVMK